MKKLIELLFPGSQILSIAFQPNILAWNWKPFAAEDISVANNKHILVKKNVFLVFFLLLKYLAIAADIITNNNLKNYDNEKFIF